MTFEIFIHTEKHEYMEKSSFTIHLMKGSQLWHQNLTQININKLSVQTGKYLFVQLYLNLWAL